MSPQVGGWKKYDLKFPKLRGKFRSIFFFTVVKNIAMEVKDIHIRPESKFGRWSKGACSELESAGYSPNGLQASLQHPCRAACNHPQFFWPLSSPIDLMMN